MDISQWLVELAMQVAEWLPIMAIGYWLGYSTRKQEESE